MDAPTPQPAPAPTATPDPNAGTKTLESLDATEMQAWKQTGDVPVREAQPAADEADEEPEPAAAVPVAGAPVSKRQQRINDQIRAAVQEATAAQDAELRRLRAQPAPPSPTPAPAPALKTDASDPEPDPSNTEKYPGGEYDPKYLRECARWDMRQEQRKERAEAQSRAQAEQRETQFRGSVKATTDAFAARTAADPEFATRLDKTLMSRLIPISQLPEDMPAGPYNIIAEELLAHPDTAPDVADHLSTHPEDVQRLTALDPRTGVPLLSARQLIRELGRIEGALKRGVEPPPLPNTITDAPAPPTTLGSRSTTAVDSAESALKRGDAAAYIAAENAKELAARRT